MDCGLPGSSVHGILWERILEWVAISFSNILPHYQKNEPNIHTKLLHKNTENEDENPSGNKDTPQKTTTQQTKAFQRELNVTKQAVVDKKKIPQIKFKSWK